MPVNDKYWIIVLICAVLLSLIAVGPNTQNPLEPASPIDLIGMATSPISPLFSSPVGTFSAPSTITFTTTDTSKTLTFTVSDDAVYKTGYISIDGNSWQPITLTGTVLGGNWLQGSSTGTVGILRSQIGTGTNNNNYIIVYTCTRGTGTWDCHDNRWQIKDFNTIKQEATCTPNCINKQCGSNGCEGSCGTCQTGYSCQTNGTCISIGSGHIYYVAVNGSDSNPGTISQPWKTWSKGFSAAKAGDTVYFRGGVYYSTSGVGGEKGMSSGTAGNPIRFFAYPGETPILDCSSHNTVGYGYNKGISMWHIEYIHMKGLHIRNVYQEHNDVNVAGIEVWDSGNLIFEEMVLYNIDGEGLTLSDYNGDIIVKNCDAYNLKDGLRTAVWPTPGSPGQDGTAFQFIDEAATNPDASDSRVFFEGCRAWNFSDNGFAGASIGYAEFKNCWAFDGGMLSGEGCGFKYASTYGGDNNSLPLARIINNCIGAMNGAYGFSPNNEGDIPLNGHYYNNFAYHNGYKGTGHGWGHGFALLNYAGNKPLANEMYSNNIAYDNEYAEINEEVKYTHQYNSWDTSVTVNAADFVSLDVSQLKAPRKADGSLPDITFGHLVEGSDLIDKGVNIGLSYSGSAPDLGAFETN